MTAYTNTRDNNVLPGVGFKDGDTLTTVNGSKWIWQNESWFPVMFAGDPDVQPLTVQRNSSGGNANGKRGIASIAVGADFAPSREEPGYIDVMRFVRKSRWRQVTLPTPYSAVAAHVTHPCFLYVPQGFGGYKWWCAYTPYPNSDSKYENPCIAVSNDRYTWAVPDGAPNPLVPHPGGTSYNADTHAFLTPDGKTLGVLYRYRSATVNELRIITTQDGKSWSAPVTIWSGVAGTSDMAAPSIWYNSTTGRWEIHAHNLDGGATWDYRKITSTDLLSGWDQTPVAVVFPARTGRRWWHSHMMRLASGQIIGVAQDNNGTAGNAGDMYLVRSDDGVNFYSAPFDNTQSWYRPSIAVTQDELGKVEMTVIGSQIGIGYIQVAIAEIDVQPKLAEIQRLGAVLAVANACAGAVLHADDFNRADSAAGLGTALSGATYTQHSGSDLIGISGNRAYNVTTGNCRATVDLGIQDFSASCVLAGIGSQGWMLFRFIDTSNFWRVGYNAPTSRLILQSVVAGAVVTQISNLGTVVAVGDIVRVEARGDEIHISQNGLHLYTHIDGTHSTGTRIGVNASGATTAYFDSLIAAR